MEDFPVEKLEQLPELLQEIPDPPKEFYIRGNLPSGELKYLAVVGSRKYTSYGKQVCQDLIAGLRGYPVCIVSGLALGMDAIAHIAALENNIPTIAFPGSGLNTKVLYPASNKHIAKRILDSGGALMSEFAPDFKATRWSFPKRNRLMAGMCHATLVVEAGIKSGTLITSKMATEYNRDVLTVPGSIYAPQSAGPHMLIRLGATPITSVDDLIQALELDSGEKEVQQMTLDLTSFSPDEQVILKLLEEPKSRSDLLSLSALSITTLSVVLSSLELKGIIFESQGLVHKK